MIDRSALLEAAVAWSVGGACVVPVRTDGSKAPAVDWKAYQHQRPGLEQVIAWMAGDAFDGFGVITGAVSGHLEMAELEGRAVAAGALEQLDAWAEDNGMGELIADLLAGYCERTPSGGIHLLYRVSDGVAMRNTRLARDAGRQVLAETRGEGGFVVVAPSGGRTHPSSTSWELVGGGPASIPTITGEQRDMLWGLLRMLDAEPVRDPHPAAVPLPGGAAPGTRPGDDFNERTSWDDILGEHGWTRSWRMGRGHAWKRPGKDTPGISATTGQAADGIDRLYVFSTSTDFESETPYTKFAAFALLEHGGDYAAAAKALAAAGYGSQPQQSTVAVAASPGPTATTKPDGTPLSPAMTLAQSEDGHSQALIAEYGGELRYCHPMGRWLHWDGSRWAVQPHGGGMAREYAKAIARAYPDDKEWSGHKKRALTYAGLGGALAMSTTDHRIEVGIDQLDARPWELNTPAGIIDLRTGLLMPSDPARLHTKSTACAPDFDADQGPWLTFLHTTFQGDAELIDYIQRLMGYACVGEVREAILPVFYGASGSNGKTVLLETVQALLGDYATVAPQHFLVQGPSQHATEIAALAGVRFVIASETNEGQRFDEAKVKILTGGDSIKARFMRQDEFTFKPSHLLVMMTNHRPEVGSGGTSFWRRLREIPFLNQIPEDKRDPELQGRLIGQHGPAIMAWLAQGAAEYAARGLKEPDKVKVATKTYEASTDTVGRFVDEMCLIGGGDAVKIETGRVRSAYELWCSQEAETPIAAKAFGVQMETRFGIGKYRNKRARFYTNVSLTGSDDGNE